MSSLKNERDWLLEMITEKKQDILEDIHAVVYQAKDMRVRCRGNTCLTLSGDRLVSVRYEELYIDCDGECQVVYMGDTGRYEIELWQFSLGELWEMVADFEVEQ